MQGLILYIKLMHFVIREMEIIGGGEFGTVCRAIWIPDYIYSTEAHEQEVAIKTLKEEASKEERVKFLQEAAIMGQFSHPNIVGLLGLVSVYELVSEESLIL